VVLSTWPLLDMSLLLACLCQYCINLLAIYFLLEPAKIAACTSYRAEWEDRYPEEREPPSRTCDRMVGVPLAFWANGRYLAQHPGTRP
jgi:hypothetical protein